MLMVVTLLSSVFSGSALGEAIATRTRRDRTLPLKASLVTADVPGENISDRVRGRGAATKRGESMPGMGASGCVPAGDDPLLRKAGMSGCLKPVRLGVMVMVPSLKEHGFMRQTSWNLSQPSSDLLQVEMLEWPTPPCTVGDSRRFAPRMRGSATTAWMRAKGRGNSTWWCAQRGHLQGVQRLVNTVPGADFYLLIDADTQGVRRPLTLPEPMSSHAPRSHAPTRYSQAPTYASRPSSEHEPHRLFCLHRSVSARHGLTSHAAGAPHPAAARGSLHRAPS